MHAFDLGAAGVFTIEASATTLRRTPRMARAVDDAPIVLALPVRGRNHLVQDGEYREFGPDDLVLVDVASPFVHRWPDGGGSSALHVDVHELDLPGDAVRRAAKELRTSPLYALVRDHVARVTAAAGALDGSARAHLGAASVQLVRALIVS